jgi:hypothetical protein
MSPLDKFSLPADETHGGTVFTPDILTPAQYYDRPTVSPYGRLLFAILEDAINCYQRNYNARTVRRRRLFWEAQQWLFDSEASSFMSCAMVCENLRIDAAGLRRSLHDWRLKAAAGENVPHIRRCHTVSSNRGIGVIVARRARETRVHSASARESGR